LFNVAAKLALPPVKKKATCTLGSVRSPTYGLVHGPRPDRHYLFPCLRKYRKSEKDLQQLRIIAGLWQQIGPFCKSQMLPSIYDKLEGDIMNTSRRGDELAELIDMQPSRFAISQLRSFKEMAMKGKAHEDKVMAANMQQQLVELKTKQFEYFEAGLRADWATLDNVKGAI